MARVLHISTWREMWCARQQGCQKGVLCCKPGRAARDRLCSAPCEKCSHLVVTTIKSLQKSADLPAVKHSVSLSQHSRKAQGTYPPAGVGFQTFSRKINSHSRTISKVPPERTTHSSSGSRSKSSLLSSFLCRKQASQLPRVFSTYRHYIQNNTCLWVRNLSTYVYICICILSK